MDVEVPPRTDAQLFFVSRGALTRLPASLAADCTQRLDAAVVRDGMPFLVENGRLVEFFNQFMRALPSLGCRSKHTWKAYARDIFRFRRFLVVVYGIGLLKATVDHVEHYRSIRLHGVKPVRESTWHRELTSLERYYRYALLKKRIEHLPFRYGLSGRNYGRPGLYHAGPRNLARGRVSDNPPIRALSIEQFAFFVKVGLLGRLPTGQPDPSFRGEHAHRNATFGEWVAGTGERVSEASPLTRLEVPPAGDRVARMLVAGPIAKGGKPRTILVPPRLSAKVAVYQRSARAYLVERHLQRDALGHEELAAARGDSLLASGSIIDIATLDEDRRWNLVEATSSGLDPWPLFLGRGGRPVKPEGWQRVFENASARCAEFETAELRVGKVTPHVLRHTFAVHMLSNLIHEQIEADNHPTHPGRKALRQVAENPIRRLQKLLGHAHVSTTWLYLDYLDTVDELVERALGRWNPDATWTELIGAD